MKWQDALQEVPKMNKYKRFGKVSHVVGLMIESIGPKCSIGDICYIYTNGTTNKKVMAEVVGFKDENIVLMPLSSISEISPGSLVEGTGKALQIKIGEELVGSVLDAVGEPLTGEALPKGLKIYSTENDPPNPLKRPPIRSQLEVGVKVIDSLLSVGNGQRLGIFAGSGVGKSTLMGMIARNSKADINVIALIGERGREVREFIENDLGTEGLKRSIVIVATSDQPPLLRLKGAFTATAIAEYFRDKGLNVMFMMDSVTRTAMAGREIGLATGEPPTTKGYTPSVFAMLPRLLERTGTNELGSITALYTVLVDGDDMNEPIADTVRGILDGHIVLDRDLAHKGQYPAINVLKSVSRVMQNITSKEHRDLAREARKVLATYTSNEDLITIGAYKKGSSAEIDHAIEKYPYIMKFLAQDVEEHIDIEVGKDMLRQIMM